MGRSEHFDAGAGAQPTCRYCGKDPMQPEDPETQPRRALSVHLVQEHPDSPEAQKMRAGWEQRNAEHEARVSSPSYQAAQRREREAFDRLQPLKHGRLYHGTDRELPIGHVITPYSKKIAHATPSAATAKVFAGGAKAVKAGQGHVYEVEHAGPTEDAWVQQMKYTGGETHHEVVSPHGFRIIRKLKR